MDKEVKRDWGIFFNSVFFVLGFSIIFSILGILLQTILLNTSFEVKVWLGRAGGLIIIFFGLFTLGLITPWFLLKEHKIKVKKVRSSYVTSFLFGAAFAFGWTPCVSAALGAIVTLAATNPSSSFLLLFSYTLGLGLPFLIVSLFINQAKDTIRKSGKWLMYFQNIFGVILIMIGILVFTDQLALIANSQLITSFFGSLSVNFGSGGAIKSLNLLNISIAFIAGLASFLSPCVLPLLPGFLSYLASTSLKTKDEIK